MNAKLVAGMAEQVRTVLAAQRTAFEAALNEEREARREAVGMFVDQITKLQEDISQMRMREMPAGAPGPQGVQGERGEQGVQGERGTAGERGIDGRDGRDGKDGKDGKDSDVTRDQLDKATSEAIAKAIEGVSFDGRVFRMGERELARIPTLRFRGVYQHGTQYEPGDTVQWGGSLYVCTETTSEKPDNSASWALAARKGRDGKDRA